MRIFGKYSVFSKACARFFCIQFFCRRSDKECVTERKLHLCTCFDDAFTNKYSVYSLNLDNGNVSQNTFVDENFMTNSFSVTDNRIYYIKTDSLKSYVACRDFSSDKKSKITFSDNVNEVFNNNGKSYARLCDGSIYKLSQSSSTYVADTGELKIFITQE